MWIERIKIWRQAGDKIVFTNGCFDLLHPGHIQYLSDAAQLGDRLIVGLNDDESVRRLKGKTRPINDLTFRTAMLSALADVDLIIPFAEDTPRNLIEIIRPDFLVKGGDYTIDTVVGYDVVKSYGGETKVLSFLKGYSSSHLIEKIKKS